MNTMFMNSGNSNIILIDYYSTFQIKRSDKYDALPNLNLYYTWKKIKKVK